MINANLIRKTGGYCNDDAIFNTITYIFRLKDNAELYYGIWPPTKENAIATFEELRTKYPAQTISKQVQHFEISFNTIKDKNFIISFADQIAFLFAPIYPVCFALHNDTDNYHVHFIISTTSHLPNHPPFKDELWKCYYTHLLKDFSFKHGISLQEVYKNA